MFLLPDAELPARSGLSSPEQPVPDEVACVQRGAIALRWVRATSSWRGLRRREAEP